MVKPFIVYAMSLIESVGRLNIMRKVTRFIVVYHVCLSNSLETYYHALHFTALFSGHEFHIDA